MSVTQFTNAMQIVNNTSSCLALSVQANGYKQLFSPSWLARNVPESSTSDGYVVNACPGGGTAMLGAGIFRDSTCDQSAIIVIGDYGTLTFNGSSYVHGQDILQNVSWNGSSRVSVSTASVTWNFNNTDQTLLTLTFS